MPYKYNVIHATFPSLQVIAVSLAILMKTGSPEGNGHELLEAGPILKKWCFRARTLINILILSNKHLCFKAIMGNLEMSSLRWVMSISTTASTPAWKQQAPTVTPNLQCLLNAQWVLNDCSMIHAFSKPSPAKENARQTSGWQLLWGCSKTGPTDGPFSYNHC